MKATRLKSIRQQGAERVSDSRVLKEYPTAGCFKFSPLGKKKQDGENVHREAP